MKRSYKILKYLLILLSSIIILDPIYGGYGGEGSKTKPEKISKYKTSNLVRYVNLSVFYLNSTKNINKRHLKVFTNCQRLFNSSKTKVKGQEIKYLKSCQNLMRKGIYSKEAFAIIQKSTKNSNPSKEGSIINNNNLTESQIGNSLNNKDVQIKEQVSIDIPKVNYSNKNKNQNKENISIDSQIENDSSNNRTENKNINDDTSKSNFNNKKSRKRKYDDKDSSGESKDKSKIKTLKDDSELFFY